MSSATRFVRTMATKASQPGFLGATKYGGRVRVTLIPGDGIGHEMAASVRKLFSEINAPIDFEEISLRGMDENASDKFDEALRSLRRNGVGLKGIISTPRGRATRKSYNMSLRTELDLFANVIVCKSPPASIQTRHKNVDLVVIRQNTEAEYSGLEHETTPGVVESLKVISRTESLRIAKYAFDFATKTGRHKVTAVHKANIMKQGDGLFLQCCKEVSALYPNIVFESMIVDNTSMQLVSKPQQFDVVVTPNLYGNIVGNIGAGLVGGAGLVPGFNIGHDHIVFEPGARQIDLEHAGQNVANPTAMVLSGAMMLKHLGFTALSNAINTGVENVLSAGKVTADLNGSLCTDAMTDEIINESIKALHA